MTAIPINFSEIYPGSVLDPVTFSEVLPGKFSAARLVEFDGVKYRIYTGALNHYFTIYTGRWIYDRRSFGKTFYNIGEIGAHYKRHGPQLRYLCAELRRLADEKTASAGVAP